jgi:calcium-dependent protein kinase
VRLCTHKASKEVRAVKILNKTSMSKSDQTKLINEIKILSELDHPNIVKMYEYFDSKKQFYIVTETCEGGELFDEIIS